MPVLYSLAACRMGTVFWPRYATAWLCRRLCLSVIGPVTSFRRHRADKLSAWVLFAADRLGTVTGYGFATAWLELQPVLYLMGSGTRRVGREGQVMTPLLA